MKTWSKILLCAVVLAVLGGGVAYWQTRKPPPPRFTLQKVARGDLTQLVNATGSLNPKVLSPVGSQVSGIVWKLHADFNDPVKQGQVLLELDPSIFQAQVEQQRANLSSALANVAKARADLSNTTLIAGRSEALAKDHYVAESDKDTAVSNRNGSEAGVKAALAQVEQARAALKTSELNLKNSVILSPVDGVVIARSVELGQAVAAAFQAPNLFSIAGDLTKMQVLANVDEADIGMVLVGQTAQFTVDAFRGQHFTATVSQVRNAPQTVQNVVTYVVVLDVNNAALLLRPGMTANVRIDVGHRQAVLLVPNAALRFKPPMDLIKGRGDKGDKKGERGAQKDGGRSRNQKKTHEETAAEARDPKGGVFTSQGTVYVQDGAQLRPVPVVTGLTDGMQTELISGLEEGREVVVEIARQPGSGTGAPPAMGSPGGQGGFHRGGI